MGSTVTRFSLFAFACLPLSGCGFWIDTLAPEVPVLDAPAMDAGPSLVDAREVGVDATFDAGSCMVNEDCAALSSVCTAGMCEGGHCVALPLDGGCDDGDSCTTGDVCSEGACVSTPIDCSTLDRPCIVGSCSDGACIATPRIDGEVCEDMNFCSWSDACGMARCGGVTTDCGLRVDTHPTPGTDRVGRVGAATFEDRCPEGQVMTGVRASFTEGSFYDHLLREYVTLCSVVRVSDTGSVSMTPGDELPPGGRGDYAYGTDPLDAACPENHVVVGLHVDVSTRLDTVVSVIDLYPSRLSLRCAPLRVVGSLATGFTASVGAVSMAEPTLGTRTSRSVAGACPAGSVATGSAGHFGDVLDRIGFLCGSIPITVVTTAPPVGTPDACSEPFRDDCPWGHVPVGVNAAITSVVDRPLSQFQTLCAPLAISGSGGGWRSAIGTAIIPASTVPWGSTPGSVTTETCPASQMIVGYQAAGNAAVSELALRCAPITVTGPSITELTFGYGASTSRTIGLPGTAALSPPADCPPGMLGRGFYGNATTLLNAVALRCSVPTFGR